VTDFVIEADLRETTGRGEARRLRRAGLMPAVIYGGGKPELAITLNAMSTAKLLDQEAFHTSIVEIKVKGSRGSNKGLVKDVQWHPVRDEAIHIDFFRVSSSDIVHIDIPLLLIGDHTAPGVKKGGMLQTIRHHLEVACRADSIPAHFEVDCSTLEIGEAIHIRDIKLPEGVHVPELDVELEEGEDEINFTLVSCLAPLVEEEPEEAVETEIGDGEAEGDDEGEGEEAADADKD